MRKSDGKNANKKNNRGQHVSVIAQENLKLATFVFHHMWRCTLDWKVTGVSDNTVHMSAGPKRIKEDYQHPDLLPMTGMMEAIIEYLRSCHGVIRAPLAYVTRKNIIVQTYSDYPK